MNSESLPGLRLSCPARCPQVDQENAALQEQFNAQLPKLKEANDEIASCMTMMEQVLPPGLEP